MMPITETCSIMLWIKRKLLIARDDPQAPQPGEIARGRLPLPSAGVRFCLPYYII